MVIWGEKKRAKKQKQTRRLSPLFILLQRNIEKTNKNCFQTASSQTEKTTVTLNNQKKSQKKLPKGLKLPASTTSGNLGRDELTVFNSSELKEYRT
jgi:hypothetical protein